LNFIQAPKERYSHRNVIPSGFDILLKHLSIIMSSLRDYFHRLPHGEGQDGASFKPKRFSKPYRVKEWRSINFPIIHAFSVSLQRRRVCHYAAYNYLFREKTMNNLAQTKDALAALAQQFRSYNYKSLNESQVRKSYIDEFWNILGWNTADIRHTDDKINRLLYELYELTDEEIRIVEGV
jgi:hypothetical protein